MKKLLFVSVGMLLLAVTSCNQNKSKDNVAGTEQNDSLQQILAQKDIEINDMMGLMNEVQEGFRQINEAENRVTIAKDGEGANKKQVLRDNVKFIAERMQKNRELIAKLRQQLASSSLKGSQLKSTIDNLVKQLDEKDQQLRQLRAELDAKDIHIGELDETINNLNTNVSHLTTESAQKTETINVQDKQLNTAWYVFGTKKELKDQRIIDEGKVLQGNFNKNYFTKIDIRVDKVIKLYSKSARLLTLHPASSYTLTRDANKEYVLTITNPQIFWSTSKYLVVQVR